jgi:hypothetical protein
MAKPLLTKGNSEPIPNQAPTPTFCLNLFSVIEARRWLLGKTHASRPTSREGWIDAKPVDVGPPCGGSEGYCWRVNTVQQANSRDISTTPHRS